eukprot:Hpha_TRINITY_DN15655_c2_g2::TRINITY_DN15655_c2_g2_i1::g.102030::m.102030
MASPDAKRSRRSATPRRSPRRQRSQLGSPRSDRVRRRETDGRSNPPHRRRTEATEDSSDGPGTGNYRPWDNVQRMNEMRALIAQREKIAFAEVEDAIMGPIPSPRQVLGRLQELDVGDGVRRVDKLCTPGDPQFEALVREDEGYLSAFERAYRSSRARMLGAVRFGWPGCDDWDDRDPADEVADGAWKTLGRALGRDAAEVTGRVHDPRFRQELWAEVRTQEPLPASHQPVPVFVGLHSVFSSILLRGYNRGMDEIKRHEMVFREEECRCVIHRHAIGWLNGFRAEVQNFVQAWDVETQQRRDLMGKFITAFQSYVEHDRAKVARESEEGFTELSQLKMVSAESVGFVVAHDKFGDSLLAKQRLLFDTCRLDVEEGQARATIAAEYHAALQGMLKGATVAYGEGLEAHRRRISEEMLQEKAAQIDFLTRAARLLLGVEDAHRHFITKSRFYAFHHLGKAESVRRSLLLIEAKKRLLTLRERWQRNKMNMEYWIWIGQGCQPELQRIKAGGGGVVRRPRAVRVPKRCFTTVKGPKPFFLGLGTKRK